MARLAPRPVSFPLLASLLLAGIALALASCGEDSDDPDEPVSAPAPTTPAPPAPPAAGDGLTVEVEPPQAAPGSTLQATVSNGTEKQFTYGAAYEIDRAIAAGWEPVKLPPRAVIEIAYVAAPGTSGAALQVELPDDLDPGRYRVVVARDVPGVGDLAGEFEVSGG